MGELLPTVAAICVGGVKEYCPYKDWFTQMLPSSFPKQPLKANFSTLCLAECVLFCFLSLSDLKSVVVIRLSLRRHVGKGRGV
jgi:hypothetical protein